MVRYGILCHTVKLLTNFYAGMADFGIISCPAFDCVGIGGRIIEIDSIGASETMEEGNLRHCDRREWE